MVALRLQGVERVSDHECALRRLRCRPIGNPREQDATHSAITERLIFSFWHSWLEPPTIVWMPAATTLHKATSPAQPSHGVTRSTSVQGRTGLTAQHG